MFLWVLSLLFSFCQQKEKGNKKERLPSALFELLRHFSTLNKKNSLRSNSFLFLTLRKAPPLHAQKVRPDILCATSLRSLEGDALCCCSQKPIVIQTTKGRKDLANIHEQQPLKRKQKVKTNQPKTSKAKLIPHPPEQAPAFSGRA